MAGNFSATLGAETALFPAIPMMPQVYTLVAKRDPARPDTLTVRYESREHALAAAAVLKEYCATVRIIDGEGAELESPRA